MNCNTNFDKHETSLINDACVRVCGGETTNGKEELGQLLYQKVPIRRANKYLSALEIVNEYAIYRNLCDQSIYSVVDIAVIDKIMKAVISNRSRLALNRKKTRVVREGGRLLREYVGGRNSQIASADRSNSITNNVNNPSVIPLEQNSSSDNKDCAIQQNAVDTKNNQVESKDWTASRCISKMVTNYDDLSRQNLRMSGWSPFAHSSVGEVADLFESPYKPLIVSDNVGIKQSRFDCSRAAKSISFQRPQKSYFNLKKIDDEQAWFIKYVMSKGRAEGTGKTCLCGVKQTNKIICSLGLSEKSLFDFEDFKELEAFWERLLHSANYPWKYYHTHSMRWYLDFRASREQEEKKLRGSDNVFQLRKAG